MKEYFAIAEEDLELPDNNNEYWIKGNTYELVHNISGEYFSLTSESGFMTHYTEEGFKNFKDLFIINKK